MVGRQTGGEKMLGIIEQFNCCVILLVRKIFLNERCDLLFIIYSECSTAILIFVSIKLR